MKSHNPVVKVLRLSKNSLDTECFNLYIWEARTILVKQFMWICKHADYMVLNELLSQTEVTAHSGLSHYSVIGLD